MADEVRITDQAQLDALIRDRLRCDGCGQALHPVLHRNVTQWTCPMMGCSKMLPNLLIEGRIGCILMEVGLSGQGVIQKTIARYKKSLLGKK